MIIFKPWGIIVSSFLAIAVMIVSASAFAEYEMVAFGVRSFGAADECPGSDLTYPVLDATKVHNALEDLGYDQHQLYSSHDVDGRDFTDRAREDWGRDENDPTGTDFADVVFYAGHGFRKCEANKYYSGLVMGDFNHGNETCLPNSKSNMIFGDSGGDANVLVFAACQSAQYCVWDHLGYNPLLNNMANILNGFHGASHDDSTLDELYEDYIYSAENNGLGDDWVDLLTIIRSGSDNDDCATSVIYGKYRSDRDNQYNNGGFFDFKDTGSHSGTGMYYICDCDPNAGDPLPSC